MHCTPRSANRVLGELPATRTLGKFRPTFRSTRNVQIRSGLYRYRNSSSKNRVGFISRYSSHRFVPSRQISSRKPSSIRLRLQVRVSGNLNVDSTLSAFPRKTRADLRSTQTMLWPNSNLSVTLPITTSMWNLPKQSSPSNSSQWNSTSASVVFARMLAESLIQQQYRAPYSL